MYYWKIWKYNKKFIRNFIKIEKQQNYTKTQKTQKHKS